MWRSIAAKKLKNEQLGVKKIKAGGESFSFTFILSLCHFMDDSFYPKPLYFTLIKLIRLFLSCV